ncbi:MAG: metallophosphoesterase [Phycisphaerae bacterium]
MNEILFAPYRERWLGKYFFKRLLWTAAGSCALGGLFAWRFEDHWLKIERRDMPLAGLGAGLNGATLAHVSDLHCSPIVLERYLHQCVDQVNALGVDFVAITGDFITGPRHYARRVARVLRHLRPKVATVACLGNHDYGIYHPRGFGGRRGLADYVAEQLTRADIFVAMNEARTFARGGATLQFVGVEDFWSSRYNPYLAFDSASGSLPTIGLCHNPDAALQVAHCGAHWVLAGHTHGSEKSEFVHDVLLPASHRHFVAGQYSLGHDRWLYVNRGLGYGRRINLNARPEITVFTLKAA